MDRWDAITATGVAALAVGLGMLSLWLAPTIIGVSLIVTGFLGAAGSQHDDRDDRRER